jgi:hypothetical protein
MKDKLQGYWNKAPDETWLATILHPNCKIDQHDPDRKAKLALIRRHLDAATGFTCETHSYTPISTPKAHRTKKNHWEEFQQLVVPPPSQKSKSSKAKETNRKVALESELEKYLTTSLAGDKIDVCIWWQTHASDYPNLSIIAMDWLAVMPTSVPCEQLFSIAGNVITKNRNKLSPSTAQALLCLKSWLSFDSTL